MSLMPKGGRGKRAPYETVVVRVPEPVLDRVEAIIDSYRLGLALEENPSGSKPVTGFEEIRERVDEWRKNAKVGKDKLKNLLQLIYGVDFDL